MRRRHELGRAPRPAFTLIELLVVMAIIGVLVGLLSSAVMKVRERAKEVEARHDISQMATSIQAFQSKMQVDFIPSRIRLYNNLARYLAPVDQLDKDSFQYLKRLWPRINGAFDNTNANANLQSRGWFPDDPGASLNSTYLLSGDQAIVFFLGGIQSGGSPRGFSTNTTNPTLLTGKMAPPFMDFPRDRLAAMTAGSPALSFLDTYGDVPYAYFSSYGGQGYKRYLALLGVTDCGNLGLAPYEEPAIAGVATKFYSNDGFQIICAGKDKTFGAGGQWDNRTGAPYSGVAAAAGADDLSNFHTTQLGNGSQ